MDRKRLKMNPLLGLALLATLVAVIFAPDEPQTPDAVVPPARKPPTQAVNSTPALPRAVPAVGQIGVGAPEVSEASEARADGEGRIADIFAVPRKRATREVRAAMPEAPIAQSAPVAQPFDYQYMGRVVDQGDEAFFFTRAGRPYIVKAGDTLDGSFLLESVIGNAAVVVYVPLKMKQTVVLGEEK